MFSTAILKLPELPPDPDDGRVYNLNPLRERTFQFVFEPGSGIQNVAMKKLRLSSKIIKSDRITLEADATANAEASKYPPVEPEALRLLVPQGGLFATA
jgi:hypothetical protein